MFNIRSYEYEPDSDVIILQLSTGGKLHLNMSDEYLAYYGGACDIELNFISDDLKDIFFKVDGKIYAGFQLVQWSEDQHGDIVREYEREAMEDEEMARELSSPYLTGRI